MSDLIRGLIAFVSIGTMLVAAIMCIATDDEGRMKWAPIGIFGAVLLIVAANFPK